MVMPIPNFALLNTVLIDFSVFDLILLGHYFLVVLHINQAYFGVFGSAGNPIMFLFNIGPQVFCTLGLNSSYYAFIRG